MNSLNILSARVSPPATPTPSRSNSYGNILTSAALGGSRRNSRGDINEKREGTEETQDADNEEPSFDEKTPLLQDDSPYSSSNSRSWHSIPKSIAIVLMDSVRWVLSTLAAPGVYLIACLYDEQGIFAPFTQIRKLGGGRSSTAQALGMSSADEGKYGHSNGRSTAGRRGGSKSQRSIGSNSSSSGLSSESESDREHPSSEGKQSSSRPRTRSQSLQKGDEIAPANKTIRIKLHNEDNLRQRRHRKTQSTSSQSNGSGAISASDPATLKSPTSPAASASLSMTKYPRAPAPPRPLIPRRQPSFTLSDMPTSKLGQKTLILDLDETLIHSMAKGGRMGTGHMIEVRLNSYGPGGNGSSHPILYWVNKRPHCDEFLRRICKWYNLVVFTASVQEYADPVIDYLEQERKFFSGRYYRQHCTQRQGAYIKDLSSVEPDLSKVMILDNSPLSYMFHQDNAIPIEGWINDPTDHDLLHLLPMLEGLQYVTDVRAFLALRGGEDGKHTMVS